MRPARWQQIQDVLAAALEKEPGQQEAYVRGVSAGDRELLEEVLSLLRANTETAFIGEDPPDPLNRSQPDSHAVDPPSQNLIGSTVAHYKILGLLGEGGMGVVYKAFDNKLERHVALKFLSAKLDDDDDAKRRLIREAKTISALDHANICTIFEIGETETSLYIAMAFYEGETLDEIIGRGPVPYAKAVSLALRIGEGLEAAHEAGIVHRDIKPSNILLTDKGVVKILDFGIAHSTTSDVTRTRGTSGTLHYMSPEQFQGIIADHRTDIWALGVILHEMLTGRKPFSGEYEAAILYSILNEAPPDLSSVNADIPAELARVVERAMDKDLGLRYQEMTDLVADLRTAQDGRQPAQGREVVAIDKRRIRRVAIASVLAVALFAVVFFIGQTIPDTRLGSTGAGPRSEKLIAILPFQFVGTNEHEYLAEGIFMTLALALNGADVVESVDYNAIIGLLGGPDAVRDPDIGIEVASHFGAGRFMMGNVTQHGDRFRVTGIMYDAEGNMLHTLSGGDIREADFVQAVDSMALEIVSAEAGEEYQGLLSAGIQTTKSIEALKAFVEAERQRRADFQGGVDELYQRAAALDTNFALPVIRQLNHLPGFGESHNQFRLDAAKRFGPTLDRLPARERDEARILFAVDSLDYHELVSRYRGLVDRWPDYAWAWYYYGDTIFHEGYFFGMPANESEPALETALMYDPGNSELAYHLSDFAARNRQFDRLDSLEKAHDGLRFGWSTDAFVALGRGDEEAFEAAKADFDSASVRQVNFLVWQSEFHGLYDEGRRVLEILKHRDDLDETPGTDLWINWHAAFLDLMQGRVRRADSLFAVDMDRSGFGIPPMVIQAVNPFQPPDRDRAELLRDIVANWDTVAAPVRWMNAPPGVGNFESGKYVEVKLFFEGALAFRAGDLDAFEASIQKLRALAQTGHNKELAYVFDRSLSAIQLREEGDLEGALEALGDARIPKTNSALSATRSQGLQRFMTAEILFEQGRYEEALTWYRSVTEIGWQSGLGIGQFLGPIWYRRGRIHDELNELDLALEYYDRFIQIWDEADPELQPWVEDARSRREAVIEKRIREPS